MSAELENYYAARAPEYDRVYQKPERQRDLRSVELWLPGVFAGRALLEIACGTGYWTQFLAPVAKRVVAIDASAEVLAIASARAKATHASFVTGDAYCLPTDHGHHAPAAAYLAASAGGESASEPFAFVVGALVSLACLSFLLAS